MFSRLKNLFIPSKENNFKPDFLEKFSMSLMLVLMILSFAIANIQSLVWMSSNWMVTAVLPAVIVDLTNDERGDGKLAPLTRNTLLDYAAQLKANDMAENGYFAHFSPSGVSPWYWFEQASYDYGYAGENLAVYFTDSGEVVEAWMESPTHRANIMNGQYNEIGVGTAKGTYKGVSTVFVVQLFGTQRVQAAVVEESPVIAEAEPIPDVAVVLATEDIPDNVLGDETEAPVIAEEVVSVPVTTSEPVKADEYSEPKSFAIYSDTATTSRPGVLAVTTPTLDGDAAVPASIQALERTATQPSVWLEFLYGIIAFLIVASLLVSIGIEWRKHHPIQIAYAGGLLAVMALLFHMHAALTGSVTIL